MGLTLFTSRFISLLTLKIFLLLIVPLTNIQVLKANTRSDLRCQGSQMILSCGNLRCDTWLGENEQTCPSDCTQYSVASYNFQEICQTSSTLLEPETEIEMTQAIRDAGSNGRHIKVVGRLHSTNSVICNDGVIISTKKLDKIYGIETYNSVPTVKVQAGVTMGQLSDWLDTQGKALGYSLMGFRGISIAGAIGTGAHGSSPKHSSVLLSIVESFEILAADNTLVEYNRLTTDPKIWKALNTNLGLLGVVLNVRLRIREQFALKTKIDFFDEDQLLTKQGNWNLIKYCDFGQMIWFPGSKTVFRTCGTEVELSKANLTPGARAAFVDFGVPSGVFPIAKAVVHAGSCQSGLNCNLEKIRVADLKLYPPMKILAGNKEKFVSEATGLSHKMMASDLNLKSMNVPQNDWAVAIPVAKLDQALIALKEKLESYKMCLPFAGIFIRYGQTDTISWLAHSAAAETSLPGEALAFIDMVVYRPVGLSEMEKIAHEVPETEIIKMLIDKFGARLHWAKNKDALLQYQLENGHLDDSIRQFLEVVDKFDPHGLYSNATADILRSRMKPN